MGGVAGIVFVVLLLADVFQVLDLGVVAELQREAREPGGVCVVDRLNEQ